MATQPPRPPIEQMTPDQLETWLRQARQALAKKMARERAYLAHRARRGTRTSTDEAYAGDQLLEADILAFLDEMLAQVSGYRVEYRTKEQ